ncbi:DUF3422 family protein [Chitinibacter tainanensis]|uniref:DUF3422 family protein n=1 Tax=Chitinibacter tainanensis TaxID=230667 RepID=UPI00041D0B1B|nr:DUF3422 domain-containing protein [Chitinibacter tainanensis]
MSHDANTETAATEFSLRLHEHPLRRQVASETHTLAYPALQIPGQVSHLAYANQHLSLANELWLLQRLCRHFGVAGPAGEVAAFSTQLGELQLFWQRHAEHSMLSISAPLDSVSPPFAQPALAGLPPEWLDLLPGQVLVAIHAQVLPAAALPQAVPELAAHFFTGHELVGGEVGDGAGWLFGDYQPDHNGFLHFVLADRRMGRRQAGRMLQRLFDIESARALAQLAPPIAQQIGPELAAADLELAELISSLQDLSAHNEWPLLQRLTRLSAQVESALSRTDHRFAASADYYTQVRERLLELRETRVQGVQPLSQFLTRRLAPKLQHCAVVAQRQRTLAQRVSRATALLRTRVEVGLEQQNQHLLSGMAERARLQLRLQETVEGLSIAAISYYLCGLLGYGLKGLKAMGMPVAVELVQGLSLPLLVAVLFAVLRRVRRKLGEQPAA